MDEQCADTFFDLHVSCGFHLHDIEKHGQHGGRAADRAHGRGNFATCCEGDYAAVSLK